MITTEWIIGLIIGVLIGAGTTLVILSFLLRKDGTNETIRILPDDVSQGTTKNMQTK